MRDSNSPATGTRTAAYRRLVWLMMALGAASFAGSCWWIVGGAGILGSPVANAFEADAATGYPNYFTFWILWVVIAGPMSILPCAALEWLVPRAGAFALIISAVFVAEAGIRAGRMFWGFSAPDVLIVIGCIAAPMFLLGLALLALGAGPVRRQPVVVALVTVLLLSAGFVARYRAVKNDWNANCPGRMHR